MRLVWYAAYGSNLSRARFHSYLCGGTPTGAGHAYPGCRDAADPIEIRRWELPRPLAFGGSSRTWGGGVALVDHDARGVAKARLYLVTFDQFADVLAQENWLEPGSVSIGAFDNEFDLGAEHTYGSVLALGELDGHSILTFTQHRGVPAAAPTTPYIAHIAQGLREAHEMTDDEIVGYLADARGVAGALDARTLRAAIGTVGT